MAEKERGSINNHSGHFYRKTWPFFLALITFALTRIAVHNAALTERLYTKGVYPVIASILSFFSNMFPFSLWDVFWIIFILVVIAGLILVFFRKIKPGFYFLRLLQVLAILYTFFYFVWGFNYFRPGISDRMSWKVPVQDEKLFRTVLDTLIAETNKNYISISKTDYHLFDSLVEESYSNLKSRLGINYPNGKRRPKNMIFSKFYGKLGLSGYFGPFFNEVHINKILLPVDYPYVLGHEKAHQLGFTSESEANLAGYVVCINSPDQRLRYSGYLSTLLYFLRDASHLGDFHDIVKTIDKRVIDDIRNRQKYYQELENVKLSDFQTSVNNSYLKANHIENGVKNYNEVVSLVIEWSVNTFRK